MRAQAVPRAQYEVGKAEIERRVAQCKQSLERHMSHTPTNKSWQHSLKPGAIVAYRFPHERRAADGEQPKVRPTLALDVIKFGDQPFAMIAYGTSSARGRAPGLLIEVNDPDELEAANLASRTVFDASRRLLVSLHSSGFASPARSDSPVIGQLAGVSAERAALVRRRVHRRIQRRLQALERFRRTRGGASSELRRAREGAQS